MLGILCIYSHKKSAYNDAFFNSFEGNYYCPPPVASVPNVLVTADPIPVPCGVCIALSYLMFNVILAGSEVLYANEL
jgi:hypothetical protein